MAKSGVAHLALVALVVIGIVVACGTFARTMYTMKKKLEETQEFHRSAVTMDMMETYVEDKVQEELDKANNHNKKKQLITKEKEPPSSTSSSATRIGTEAKRGVSTRVTPVATTVTASAAAMPTATPTARSYTLRASSSRAMNMPTSVPGSSAPPPLQSGAIPGPPYPSGRPTYPLGNPYYYYAPPYYPPTSESASASASAPLPVPIPPLPRESKEERKQ